MAELRRVQYTHTFFHGDDELRQGSLLTFLYDIPYFPPCRVFPPFHLLNQYLSIGGSDGGMSPGAIWEPFTITPEEYAQLVDAIESTSLEEIKRDAHYAIKRPVFDHGFDEFQNYFEWLLAVCEKHGERKLPEEVRKKLLDDLQDRLKMESE